MSLYLKNMLASDHISVRISGICCNLHFMFILSDLKRGGVSLGRIPIFKATRVNHFGIYELKFPFTNLDIF